MKLNTKTNEVYSELDNNHEFTIAASEKAFKILSSNLYEDKIKAIIRELSTNAVDAQIEAGNHDKPFDVKLPNIIDPQFYIRDYGTGLTETQVKEIYTVLFASTKTDSNDFTGCLGLGSKTPFSYTDSFNVTSYVDGTETIYTAYITDTGVPAVSKLTENKTDEENGLKIQFSVKEKDFSDFKNKAQSVYKFFFGIAPNVLGEQIDVGSLKDEMYEIKPDIFIEKSVANRHSSREGYIIQGNIAYPFDLDRCENFREISSKSIQFKTSCSIFVKVDIGDIEFTPSRERIEDSKENYDFINKKLEG